MHIGCLWNPKSNDPLRESKAVTPSFFEFPSLMTWPRLASARPLKSVAAISVAEATPIDIYGGHDQRKMPIYGITEAARAIGVNSSIRAASRKHPWPQ